MARRKINLFPLLLVLALGLGVAAVGLFCGCTVAPQIVEAKRPAFDRNSQNAGLIDLGPVMPHGQPPIGPAHVTSQWILDYQFLARKYGKDLFPVVNPDEKFAEVSPGVFEVDLQHVSNKNVMTRMQASGIEP